IAVVDLVAGVSNDAVNFLNSSIGSKVASIRVILIVASLGILCGVLFSSGMMEVARKGIFNPSFFTMPDLIMIFMAVMIADILVLDLFNTYGLPTSTTVSIVFELLGAAVAMSLIKILNSGDSISTLSEYINSAKALSIIGGILLSIVVAFTCGAVVQFVARVLFTFEYEKRLKAFGGIWGGLSVACIILFLLIKGMKGATFITPELADYIYSHLTLLFLCVFVVFGVLLQLLVNIFSIDIFKPIVLLGTFSLALAFAANDLVNFVGVPIAGYHAYAAAYATSDPLHTSMAVLSGKVPTSWVWLMASGVIMVFSLWFSKKARTVVDTSLNLSTHDEENERFESFVLSRAIVRMFSSLSDAVLIATPRAMKKFVRRRFLRTDSVLAMDQEREVSFDLVRAST
ncbi:MAG: inorganic phosphate transporter, partial [Bdellovibrionales bacterium]|nr:inorganic phosphate transporter [Bdellovibrionales bacterium]